MTDFTEKIADYETAKAAERLASHPPAYAAVLIAAASVDMDRDLLATRVDRIVAEIRDLAEEAIRIRDQHEMRIAALAAIRAAPPTTVVRLDGSVEVVEMPPPLIPPTLVHWIRRQVALTPLGSDNFPVLREPNVTLGELRAFLSAYDSPPQGPTK